ncbi:GNAT family N-acetyltransferase [Streptomyces mayteni]
MSTVFMRRLSRWQAESEREHLGDLYLAACQEAPDLFPLGREEFIRQLVDEDSGEPEFDMMVASEPALVGCVYGHRADRGSPWWEAFDGVPSEIAELTAARQVFVITTLLVAPHRRRQRVATKLQRQLLARSRAGLHLTLLDPGNAPARAAFQSWGWTKAGQLAPADGSPPREAWTSTG